LLLSLVIYVLFLEQSMRLSTFPAVFFVLFFFETAASIMMSCPVVAELEGSDLRGGFTT
jgi:hypothetical protein